MGKVVSLYGGKDPRELPMCGIEQMGKLVDAAHGGQAAIREVVESSSEDRRSSEARCRARPSSIVIGPANPSRNSQWTTTFQAT